MIFEALIPLTFFAVVFGIVKVLSDNHLRKMLIERGELNENARFVLAKYPADQAITSIKWGIVLVGLGTALLFRAFYPEVISDEGTAGLMLLLAGVGLLVYYFIARKFQTGSENYSG